MGIAEIYVLQVVVILALTGRPETRQTANKWNGRVFGLKGRDERVDGQETAYSAWLCGDHYFGIVGEKLFEWAVLRLEW